MGCFLACFGTNQHRKHRKLVNASPSTDQSHENEATEALLPIQAPEQEDIEKPIDLLITESKLRAEEESNCSFRKKVTFDLSVNTYEEPSTEEVINNLEEKIEEKESETIEESKPFSGSVPLSTLSYPSNHRYQNCTDSDHEYEELLDLVESDQKPVPEDSSESLFSISIDSRKHVSAIEADEKEVSSPMPARSSPDEEFNPIGWNQNSGGRSEYVHPVLNPIEKLTQCKAVLKLVESDLDDDIGNETLVPEESSESLFSVSIGSRKHVSTIEAGEKEVNSPMPASSSPEEELKPIGLNQNAGGRRGEYVHSVLNPIENLTQRKAVMKLVESDSDDDIGNDQTLVPEESSESLFSVSIGSKKHVSAIEAGEKEVNSPMPARSSPEEVLKPIGLNQNAGDRSEYVHSVLNPIENLTQWKAAKARTPSPLKHQAKENINLEPLFDVAISPELPSFKQSNRKLKAKSNDQNQEIAVDTSLSSWLVESENTPMSKNSTNSVGNSPKSHEDRPILGALTIEELKQFSASTSPRRTRSRSPDDMTIIGTVGSYWSHTGQTMDSDSGSSCRGMANTVSKHREDERVKWNSTPFEARLERALEGGIAEA